MIYLSLDMALLNEGVSKKKETSVVFLNGLERSCQKFSYIFLFLFPVALCVKLIIFMFFIRLLRPPAGELAMTKYKLVYPAFSIGGTSERFDFAIRQAHSPEQSRGAHRPERLDDARRGEPVELFLDSARNPELIEGFIEGAKQSHCSFC